MNGSYHQYICYIYRCKCIYSRPIYWNGAASVFTGATMVAYPSWIFPLGEYCATTYVRAKFAHRTIAIPTDVDAFQTICVK